MHIPEWKQYVTGKWAWFFLFLLVSELCTSWGCLRRKLSRNRTDCWRRCVGGADGTIRFWKAWKMNKRLSGLLKEELEKRGAFSDLDTSRWAKEQKSILNHFLLHIKKWWLMSNECPRVLVKLKMQKELKLLIVGNDLTPDSAWWMHYAWKKYD